MPAAMVDSAWLEHAPFAFWLVNALRPQLVVELGTHGGFSYFCFCQAIQQLDVNARAFAVDTWKGDEHSGFYGEDVFENFSRLHEQYNGFSTPIRSTFDEALPRFPDGSIDLLHIDGRHFYADVKHEFECWRPKLSDRSVVLFHDTNVQERDFGVFKLWQELKDVHASFEFFHAWGLGVLGFGAHQVSRLSDFFAEMRAEEAASLCRQTYARLGKSVSGEAGKHLSTGSFEQNTKQHGQARLDSEQALDAAKQGFEQRLREESAAFEKRFSSETLTFQRRIQAEEARHQVECAALEARLESALAEADRGQQEANDRLQSTQLELDKVRAAGEAQAETAQKLQAQLEAENEKLRSEYATLEICFEGVYAELCGARRRPIATFRRYMRWQTSKQILQISSLLPEKTVGNMQRRLEKNSPIYVEGLFGSISLHSPVSMSAADRKRLRKVKEAQLLLRLGAVLPSRFRRRMERRVSKNSELIRPHIFDVPKEPDDHTRIRQFLNYIRDPSRGPLHHTEGVLARADARYAAWLRVNSFTEEAAAALRDALAMRAGALPSISVIMPAYNTPVGLLDRAIESVRNQVYEAWQLCIADDASSNSETVEALRRWALIDNRIKVIHLSENGNISLATNSAVLIASGDFLVFLDHDDELTPDALGEIALAISASPEADYLYSDDDKIDTWGQRFAPQFKPDWSPTLLLSYMYMGHVKVVRRTLFEELGGFRLGFEGSQDYDFALRATERARRVIHIPKVLYHWRVVPGSTAASGDAKAGSFEAGCRAVADALERRGIAGEVVQPNWAVQARAGIFATRFPNQGPSVAIIIPIKNKVELLRDCLQSLKKTAYRNYEIVIVDNESDDPKALSYLASLPHRVLRIGNPTGERFSFAHINNEAVRQLDVDYVLFLNNDTKLRAPEWLSQMVGYAQMEQVGAVGARLLFGDETVQHAGIVHGYYDGMAGPAFRNAPAHEQGYLGYGVVAREYSAVTAACLLTPRSLFLELGGFDATRFAVAYNDVDYCYRLVDAGWRCIYCPSAELFHFEGKSRGEGDNPREIAAFRQLYGQRIDPWYNPNLSLEDEHFRVQPYRAPSHAQRIAPVRTVMVSHNLNHEGAPNSQFELAAGLKQSGIIDPIVLSPVDGPLRASYEKAGIPVRVVSNPIADAHTAAVLDEKLDGLGALFREVGAEVVYGNTLVTFWAIAAAERAGLPSLWNPRESEPWQTYFDHLAPELRQRAYACFAFPYRVIFVAHATRSGWAPLESRFNFTVIHNGLNLTRFETRFGETSREQARRSLGIEEDEVAVLLVGTVCERKGQLDLVRSLRKLTPSAAGRIRAFIVGDRAGPYSSALHKEVATLPEALRQRIAVVQETGNIPVFYRAADIAICSSRIESYPRVVLESMACGLPLITTPVFGIREQVREGLNALLYEPGDINALATALSRLIDDDQLRHAMAASSQPVLGSLTSYSEMLARYGQIFREARLSRGQRYKPCGGTQQRGSLI